MANPLINSGDAVLVVYHMKAVLYILRELYKFLRAELKRLLSLLYLLNKYNTVHCCQPFF